MQRRVLYRRSTWLLTPFFLGLLLFLSACGSLTPEGQRTQQYKAALDAELAHAQHIGVPQSMLAPLFELENQVAQGVAPVSLFGDKNSDSVYQNASASYQVLLANVQNVENQATQLAEHQADVDIGDFAAVLQLRQNANYPQVPDFQTRLNQAEQDYSQAQTPAEYAKVSAFAATQTQALTLLQSTKDKLDQLHNSLDQMKSANLDTSLGDQEYQDDLNTFKVSEQSDQLLKLQQLLDAQIEQLAADQTAAIPYVGAAMLQSFQNLIDQAKQYGEDTSTYQQEHDQDAQDLQNAHTIQQYLDISVRIQSQSNSMSFILIRGKTRYDLQTLQNLIGQTDINNDYEYRDADDAYGDESYRLQQAQTSDDYQKIDDQLTILITNLNALLTNLKDPNYDQHDQSHQVDLQLMQAYHMTTGKVMVVSLTEQTARMYENGQMVHWFYVVTGQRAAQSPPGVWPIFYKGDHLVFKSAEPPGSPLWYPDTPINYAMEYHAGGFFYHDATWRSYFGPGANLPHDDYTSGSFSDNGSHGCINMSLSNAAWLYQWLDIGTPTIVF